MTDWCDTCDFLAHDGCCDGCVGHTGDGRCVLEEWVDEREQCQLNSAYELPATKAPTPAAGTRSRRLA